MIKLLSGRKECVALSQPWETDPRQDKAPIDPLVFQKSINYRKQPKKDPIPGFFFGGGGGRDRGRSGKKPDTFPLTFNTNNILYSYSVTLFKTLLSSESH